MFKPSWKTLLFIGGFLLFIAFNWADSYFHETYMPRLKNQIETMLAEKMQARAYIKHLDAIPKWPRLFPLTIVMEELHIERDFEFTVKIPKATAEIIVGGSIFRFKDFYPDVKVDISDVDIRYDLKEAKPGSIASQQAAATQLPQNLRELAPKTKLISDISTTLNVKNLKMKITKNRQPFVQFEQVHVVAQTTSLDQPVFLTLSTQFLASNPIAPFWIPISIQSQLSLKNSALQVASADIKVLGLTSRSKGEINLSNDKIQLESSIQANDLSQIPLNLKDFPITKWSGAANFGVKVSGTKQNPQVEGSLSLSKAQLQLALVQPQIKAQGLASGDFNLRFFWNGALNIPLIQWNFDLQQLDFKYSDLFHKPGTYPFKSSGKMTWNQDFNLENLQAQLGPLHLSAQGVYRPSGDSDLNFQVPLTDLSGMEKLILPLSRFPLQGRLALQAALKGPLQKRDLIRVELSQFKIENFSSTVAYRNEQMALDGAIKLNASGNLSMQGMDVRAGGFDLEGDFSGLQLQYKNLFKKNRGELAKISLHTSKQGNKILLRNSQLQTPAGALEFSGEPPLHPTAPFRMAVETKSLDLQKLSIWLPEYKKLIPAATLRTRMEIAGHMNTEDFLSSPLKTIGSVALKIPKIVLPKVSEVESKASTNAAVAAPTALLPDKTFFRGMDLNAKLELGEFSMPPYKAQGIAMSLNLKELKLQATGSVQKVFGGQVAITSLSVPLQHIEPRINFAVKADNIRMEKVTATMMPQFEKLVQAQAQCEISGESPWPTSKLFLPGISASGKMRLTNGVLSTLELANMLKDVFAKIPQARPEMLSQRGPLQITEGLASFRMFGGMILLQPFIAKTARKDELNIAGQLDLMMNMSMKGSLALADGVQSLGSLYEANKDAQGRLVIPLEINGNALKPELKMAQDVINKMLANTLDYEKNKTVDMAKKNVSNAIDKKKNELGDELKKKVQSLFR